MKKVIFFLFYIVLGALNILNSFEILFNNPNDAVNFALQNSQVYILERQRVLLDMKEAKFNVVEFLPTFSFSFSENDSTVLLAGDNRTRSFQATIGQSLFDGGRNKYLYEINRLSSMYAYQDFESSLMDYSSQIILLYYQYLMQRQKAQIMEDLVFTAKRQIDIIQREVEIGITLETDYLEYLISFIGIENERDQSWRDLAAMERRFKIAMGLDYEANLVITDNYYSEFLYFYYEIYTDYIWAIIRNASTEIKKQNLALEYARKQLAYSRRWFVPRLSAEAGISFSGDAYPLTEPSYSFKLTVDFYNARLFPLSFSNSYGFDNERLYNVNNIAGLRLEPQPTYLMQRKLADISILDTNIQRIQVEKDIRESVYDLVISHDNTLRYADAAEQTIVVLERRLDFSRIEVEQGEKKHIDYLNELITMAQTKISLLEYQTQAAALERSLEILAGFPFGDLQNVCEQQNY